MSQKPETTAITAGRDGSRALAPALWPSTVWSSEGLDDTNTRAIGTRQGDFYGRYANPTVTQFEHAVAALEGGESALAFGSGMGAIASTVLALCSSGSHIVAQNTLYGGTLAFLEGPCRRLGISTTYVDVTVPGSVHAAVQPGKTMLVIVETPSNPRLALADLREIGAISGPFTLVDSTMATPLGQRPLDFGCDLVMHSATKGIGGHNDAMLGVIAGARDLVDAIWAYGVLHGATASPHDALNGLRGIRTLPVRIKHQSDSALHIATEMASHPRIIDSIHPFLDSHPQRELARTQMSLGGSMLSLDIEGGIDAVRAMMLKLSLIKPATSFGGPETLICHPATSTHVGLPENLLNEMGVTTGLVRISVGLEHPHDILDDLRQALA